MKTVIDVMARKLWNVLGSDRFFSGIELARIKFHQQFL